VERSTENRPTKTSGRDPAKGDSTNPTIAAAQLAATARVVSVQPDEYLDNLFQSYGDSGVGWTGGDGGASVGLPNGKVFWAFSDTWLAPVIDGLRPPNTPLLANSVVIQNGSQLATLHGGTSSSPQAFLNSDLPNLNYYVHYWNNGAIVSNNTLYVSYSGYIVSYSYLLVNTVIAAFSLPDLSLESVTPVPDGSTIKWGVSMMNDGGYTYIYGAGFPDGLTYMYVARAPEDDLLGPWQYFNGSTWSDDVSDAAPLTNVVKDPYSVGKIDGVYVLFTMVDAQWSDEMQAYFGPTPTGPFSRGQNIYSTALPGEYGSLYEYGAYLHPEFTNGNTVVVSYEVNSTNGQSLVFANLIRPRYIYVTIRVGKDAPSRSTSRRSTRASR
jgi:hypothetical protein